MLTVLVSVISKVLPETLIGCGFVEPRALAWHARGHRFDSDILHHSLNDGVPLRYAVFVAF